VIALDGTKAFNKTDALEIVRTLAQPPYIYMLERCSFDDRPKLTVTKKVVESDGTVNIHQKTFRDCH